MANELYATLLELKKYLGISDGTDDDELTGALASTSRGIDKHCGHSFTKDVTATARVYYPRGHVARVDDFHTTTGLVVATDDGDAGTYGDAWAEADYQLEPLNGVVDGEPGWPYTRIRAIGRSFPCTQRAPLQVTAQWGWAEVPSPVKQACLIVAAETFKLKDAPFGVAGFGEFGAVRVRENPIACAKLHPYRRGSMAWQGA